jgi:hypothetical protein
LRRDSDRGEFDSKSRKHSTGDLASLSLSSNEKSSPIEDQCQKTAL